MAAFSSDARRRNAAMLWPRQTSSSCSAGEPPEVTGGVPEFEQGIWGGGELPEPPVLPPPPPPPLLQYVIMVSPEKRKRFEISLREGNGNVAHRTSN